MLRQKTGLPEEGELVLCTVQKVQHSSVFVKLNEYDETGLIHISEVAPGRIRNIRDFVKEGKVIVCKVLRITKERNYIDLSLRRVTEMQHRSKINELKQEQIAEKILEQVCTKHKMDVKEVYKAIAPKVFASYDLLYDSFYDANTDAELLKKLTFPAAILKELQEMIHLRIKPEQVTIGGKFSLSSYASNGVEVIRSSIKKGQATVPQSKVKYLGGGKFQIMLTEENYKVAEKNLKAFNEAVQESIEIAGGTFSFNRVEK
ncbi:MAG: S1 RNA-binding domain-containing protein [Nanoarchaeota archaeon]